MNELIPKATKIVVYPEIEIINRVNGQMNWKEYKTSINIDNENFIFMRKQVEIYSIDDLIKTLKQFKKECKECIKSNK